MHCLRCCSLMCGYKCCSWWWNAFWGTWNAMFSVVSSYRLQNVYQICVAVALRADMASINVVQKSFKKLALFPPFCTTGGLLQRTKHWLLIYISNTEYNCKGIWCFPSLRCTLILWLLILRQPYCLSGCSTASMATTKRRFSLSLWQPFTSILCQYYKAPRVNVEMPFFLFFCCCFFSVEICRSVHNHARTSGVHSKVLRKIESCLHVEWANMLCLFP